MRSTILTCLGVLLITAAGGQSDIETNQNARPKGQATAETLKAANGDATRQKRLQWNLDTLVGDYEHHGHQNPKWDKPVRQALEAFAQIRSSDPKEEKLRANLQSAIATNVSLAITNGCDDPMITYLYGRSVSAGQAQSLPENANLFRNVAEAIGPSQRAVIRKFYAALRAAEEANDGSVSGSAEAKKWRGEAKKFMREVATTKDTPPGEVFDAWDALMDITAGNKPEFDDVYLSLEPIIFANWPDNSALLLLKGYFYAEYAWEARGTGFSQSVTDNEWRLFSDRLNTADVALQRAWKLDPHDERIARRMITVELGLGRGRKNMELWFDRAMALNPNYYDACYAKLHYLKPQWYGSKGEMLAFASECLNSTNWGGNIPLIVLDTHEFLSASIKDREDRKAYFRQPGVWKDIKQAFDKFFRLNPQFTGWHHNYALYAYWAQQWADLNRELTLLGKVNYDYFGGKAEFEKIVQAAKEHSKNPSAP